MLKMAVIVAGVAVGLSGCAAGSVLGLGAADGVTTSRAYLAQESAADLLEMSAARIALEKARSPDVRALAQVLLADHTLFANRLAGAALHDGLTPPPPALEPAQQAALASLQAADEESFDRLYLAHLRRTHGGAFARHRRYALLGDEPKLRTLAGTASYWDHEHLRLAQRID